MAFAENTEVPVEKSIAMSELPHHRPNGAELIEQGLAAWAAEKAEAAEEESQDPGEPRPTAEAPAVEAAGEEAPNTPARPPRRPPGRPGDRPRDRAIAEAYAAGETVAGIARRFGVGMETVRRARRAAGIPPRTPGQVRWRSPPPPPPAPPAPPPPAAAPRPAGPRWCDQCDRRVAATEAAACGAPFCKAKDEAA